MSQPVQCKQLCCCLSPRPLTRLSCFHCPVYRCYESALGAAARVQTGTGGAPSRFYGAPRGLRVCCVTSVSAESSPNVYNISQQLGAEEHVQRGSFDMKDFIELYIYMFPAEFQNTEICYLTCQIDFLNFRINNCLIYSQNSKKQIQILIYKNIFFP